MTVRFVEEKVLPDDGQVNHALRGALSYLLKDYLVNFISSIPKINKHLNKIHFKTFSF